MDSPASSITNRAWHACASCKTRKRKCDKTIPACGLCQRSNWTCEYPTPDFSSPGRQEPTESGVALLGASPQQHTAQHLEYLKSLAVFFLDAHTFRQSRLEIPRLEISIPPNVQALNGDVASVRAIATEYFRTIHSWMPMVSKQNFYRHLLNPLSQPRTDVALLLLCMRLVLTVVPDQTPPSTTVIYLAAKQFCLEIETTGTQSLQALQAKLLISIYELGHAIYPAAYMSIGACARYGISLGIDGRDTPQATPPGDWTDIEERKRVWWAVLILDRAVNLGNPMRALATEEPNSSKVLPVDDEAWDKGVLPSEDVFTLSSPSCINMGRFARFAQATYLLGQVLRHISDNTVDKSFRDVEAAQLRRTLYALVNLSEVEGQVRNLEFCTQTAICHSALLILEDFYIHTEGKALNPAQRRSSTMVIAEAAARICRGSLQLDKPNSKMISPFLLYLLYRTSDIYAEIYSDTGSEESAGGVRDIKHAMTVLSARWKSADAYLQILQAREVIYSW